MLAAEGGIHMMIDDVSQVQANLFDANWRISMDAMTSHLEESGK